MFIEILQSNGKPITINTDNIQFIEPYDDGVKIAVIDFDDYIFCPGYSKLDIDMVLKTVAISDSFYKQDMENADVV